MMLSTDALYTAQEVARYLRLRRVKTVYEIQPHELPRVRVGPGRGPDPLPRAGRDPVRRRANRRTVEEDVCRTKEVGATTT